MEGEVGRGEPARPPPPVLLVDGQNMSDDFEKGDMKELAGRLDELVTSEELPADNEYYTESYDHFEKVIGAIEEIVVGEEFQKLQNFFLSTYWTKFSEQNHGDNPHALTSDDGASSCSEHGDDERHEHFKIFQSYSQEMAQLLESQLKKTFRDEHFNFNKFVEDFGRRVESSSESGDSSMFESEIFEMLFTLIDFVKFKELFTDYKEMMEGKTPNLSTGITLKSVPATPRGRSAEDLE